MDRLRERLTVAARAVETLRELALLSGPTRTERDGAIQRFEYSFEATWKAGQRHLQVVEGTVVGSPKAAIRASRESGLLDATTTEQALGMADDRNLTAHLQRVHRRRHLCPPAAPSRPARGMAAGHARAPAGRRHVAARRLATGLRPPDRWTSRAEGAWRQDEGC